MEVNKIFVLLLPRYFNINAIFILKVGSTDSTIRSGNIW